MNNEDCKPQYTNGYVVEAGTGDVCIKFSQNRQTTTHMLMSYHLAKTLSAHLSGIIAEFEVKTKVPVLSTTQINERLFGKKEKK